ncbi:unnamed protein product [Mytilus edulis]|uniref:Uncharacterized protein n=1 Tax=Mytilus edulis TaxID=6550 RepID=A0A8S3UME2_MYTED|nr:unnamed protein product [Mytilus edulis]
MKHKVHIGLTTRSHFSALLRTSDANSLQSVYPNRRNPNVRKDLNRSILPREIEGNTPAYILWSSNRNDEMTYAHWIPNHFCPILKMSINDDVLEYSTDTLGDIDLENISWLSEQLAPWVMDLLDDSDSEVSNNQYNMNETTADQHSLLDKLTENQSSMTVKPKDVQPFASVQPEVALMANLQDKSEQRDNSIVLFKEKPLYDQLVVSEHYTKRCNEQQRVLEYEELLNDIQINSKVVEESVESIGKIVNTALNHCDRNTDSIMNIEERLLAIETKGKSEQKETIKQMQDTITNLKCRSMKN